VKKIYIAGPYRSDPVKNTYKAIKVADEIIKQGNIPFIPHLNLLWDMVSPQNESVYLKWDLEWLKVCDELVRIHGKSSGADKEVELAKKLGIPVKIWK
jgi:hypothetical protein